MTGTHALSSCDMYPPTELGCSAGLCPEMLNRNRTVGSKTALCTDSQSLGRIVIGGACRIFHMSHAALLTYICIGRCVQAMLHTHQASMQDLRHAAHHMSVSAVQVCMATTCQSQQATSSGQWRRVCSPEQSFTRFCQARSSRCFAAWPYLDGSMMQSAVLPQHAAPH